MSIMDKLKAAMSGDGPKIPGGLRGIAAVAAVAWGSNTATRLVGEALDQRQALEGDLLALNQAIANAREEFERVNVGAEPVALLLEHNHAKIADAIAAGRFDQSVRERMVALGHKPDGDCEDLTVTEFAALNTTADVPHRLLDVDEPVPGIEPSEVED